MYLKYFYIFKIQKHKKQQVNLKAYVHSCCKKHKKY